jgi:L-fuconate dehydratase
MLDANQKWNVPQALDICKRLGDINPYWIEEPTHPDDIFGHQAIAKAIAPFKIATGEHIPNKVIFKNFLQAKAMDFCQVDAVRVGGVSEFLVISLLSKKFGIPVLPHVGDMGQIHQHLVLFNHIGVGHEICF